MSDSKGYPVSVRLTEATKTELESAAWIEGVSVNELIREGIEVVLTKVRAKHGGMIPSREEVLAALGKEPKKGKKK